MNFHVILILNTYFISVKCTTVKLTLLLSKHHTKKNRGVWRCRSSHSSPRHEMEVLGIVSGVRSGGGGRGRGALQLRATKDQFGRFREEKNFYPPRNVRPIFKKVNKTFIVTAE